ncbi:hypothetical protein [Rhizobium jaguaris]|uniref:Uncharacterized protein n=1 Tax=Rhizobium jaguaris TaxID=1312183 RepID=A0A387G8J0_9HYPH|nr:hypothetical protein [Rhizobium jaguaris]AYG64474.1 hypothetical protein CCGE525_37765 [Rhizobium jaguaris]
MNIVNLPSRKPVNGHSDMSPVAYPTFTDIQMAQILEHERQQMLFVVNYLEAMHAQMLTETANEPLVKLIADENLVPAKADPGGKSRKLAIGNGKTRASPERGTPMGSAALSRMGAPE